MPVYLKCVLSAKRTPRLSHSPVSLFSSASISARSPKTLNLCQTKLKAFLFYFFSLHLSNNWSSERVISGRCCCEFCISHWPECAVPARSAFRSTSMCVSLSLRLSSSSCLMGSPNVCDCEQYAAACICFVSLGLIYIFLPMIH